MRIKFKRCLGSGQHLKNRYGNGYLLEMKLKPLHSKTEMFRSQRRNALLLFVSQAFTQSTIHETFEDRIVFNVPQEGIESLAETFEALEAGTY